MSCRDIHRFSLYAWISITVTVRSAYFSLIKGALIDVWNEFGSIRWRFLHPETSFPEREHIHQRICFAFLWGRHRPRMSWQNKKKKNDRLKLTQVVKKIHPSPPSMIKKPSPHSLIHPPQADCWQPEKHEAWMINLRSYLNGIDSRLPSIQRDRKTNTVMQPIPRRSVNKILYLTYEP
ncbi:conserved domain protein [Trichinella spiralis]|uniref:hypothetical protein n=1 Tax=Trichinella spiralis TaxID=6334 RepID=UPI0001EFD2D6|nr:conserved domain protein [Trichinella spiralis]